jgi:hypothetical protein
LICPKEKNEYNIVYFNPLEAGGAGPRRGRAMAGKDSMGSPSCEHARRSFTFCATSVIDNIITSFCRSAISFQEQRRHAWSLLPQHWYWHEATAGDGEDSPL